MNEEMADSVFQDFYFTYKELKLPILFRIFMNFFHFYFTYKELKLDTNDM